MAIDAPAQALTRMQRVEGEAALAVGLSAGRTRIRRLFQEGSAKIRMPASEAGPLQAILINTAGGLTGGDRIAWSVEVGAGASAVVTTQACEKLYRSSEGVAEAWIRLRVGEGASLAWLPQETIAYDLSAFDRVIEADLAAGSRLLLAEATLFGRRAMGETVRRGLFRDRWRIRRDGRLVHAEALALGPEIASTLSSPAAAGGASCIATVLSLADDAAGHLAEARRIVGDGGGASFWEAGGSGKLLARLVARDGHDLRRRLTPLLELLNDGATLPKAWSL